MTGGRDERGERMMKEDLSFTSKCNTIWEHQQTVWKKVNGKFRLRGDGTSGGRNWDSYLTAGTVRHQIHANKTRLHYGDKSMKPTLSRGDQDGQQDITRPGLNMTPIQCKENVVDGHRLGCQNRYKVNDIGIKLTGKFSLETESAQNNDRRKLSLGFIVSLLLGL